MNPFRYDKAIQVLDDNVGAKEFHGLDLSGVPSCKAAMRLLEMAQEVSSDDILQHLAGFVNVPVGNLLAVLKEDMG